jgi:hypothetical protein
MSLNPNGGFNETNFLIFVAEVHPHDWSSDLIRFSEPMQILLKLNIYDHQGSLRQAMAGCISIYREEIISNSRLQRLSATLTVFSEASENSTAWVFYNIFTSVLRFS